MVKSVSIAQIRQAARKIASRIHPEQVILFGSYAYGKPTADSDVDFLVVIKKGTRKARRTAWQEASSALSPRPFPADFIVRSKSQIKSRIAQGDFFLQDIMEHGRVLYPR